MTYTNKFKPLNMRTPDLGRTLRIPELVDRMVSNLSEGLEKKILSEHEIKQILEGSVAVSKITPRENPNIYSKLNSLYKTLFDEQLPVYVTK